MLTHQFFFCLMTQIRYNVPDMNPSNKRHPPERAPRAIQNISIPLCFLLSCAVHIISTASHRKLSMWIIINCLYSNIDGLFQKKDYTPIYLGYNIIKADPIGFQVVHFTIILLLLEY